jgi:hypothetical protein
VCIPYELDAQRIGVHEIECISYELDAQGIAVHEIERIPYELDAQGIDVHEIECTPYEIHGAHRLHARSARDAWNTDYTKDILRTIHCESDRRAESVASVDIYLALHIIIMTRSPPYRALECLSRPSRPRLNKARQSPRTSKTYPAPAQQSFLTWPVHPSCRTREYSQ